MDLLKYSSERLLYLSMLGFVFIGSFIFRVSKPVETDAAINYIVREDLSPMPILKYGSDLPLVSAQGVLVIDLDSRVILYQKEPNLSLYPASTTKIMTALVSLDYFDPETNMHVNGIKVLGKKMGLYTGMNIKFSDLLSAMLVYSANDAAEVIADNYPGGRSAFIKAMNIKAFKMGLRNTSFSNPSGLDSIDNISTARDMAVLAETAMQDKRFSEIVKLPEKIITNDNGEVAYKLHNTNELLGRVPGVLGVKTGWTENARENLITYVERDNKRILMVLLGSQDRFGESEQLINWVFESYDWRVPQVPYSD